MANTCSTLVLVAICVFLGAMMGVEANQTATCWGTNTIGECEMNRRVLATADYISYGALESNTVPCSQKGASYYNCQKGAEANPYDRGCSQLAKCRS